MAKDTKVAEWMKIHLVPCWTKTKKQIDTKHRPNLTSWCKNLPEKYSLFCYFWFPQKTRIYWNGCGIRHKKTSQQFPVIHDLFLSPNAIGCNYKASINGQLGDYSRGWKEGTNEPWLFPTEVNTENTILLKWEEYLASPYFLNKIWPKITAWGSSNQTLDLSHVLKETYYAQVHHFILGYY